MPPTQQQTATTAPQAPQAAPQQATPAPLPPAAYDGGAFDVVDGATPRLRLRARDDAAAEVVVELGVVARTDRRLLVAVHAGRTYVGIAPDATPALEDEATGEIAPGVPGLALSDALLCLVDGRGLRPHAAWVTGVAVAPEGRELRLRVVVRNPFLRMAALCERAGGACLVQTLRLHAL